MLSAPSTRTAGISPVARSREASARAPSPKGAASGGAPPPPPRARPSPPGGPAPGSRSRPPPPARPRPAAGRAARGDPPRGSVGMAQQSQLLQLAHGVSDGGGGDAQVIGGAHVLGADRLGARHVTLDDERENAAQPRVQLE